MQQGGIGFGRLAADDRWFLGPRSRLVWTIVTSLFLWLPLSAQAVVLTNTVFTNFLTAVQSGSIAFAVNGTVTFADTVVVTNDTTIDATGFAVVLSGNNRVRLFEVRSNVSLILINVTLANGNSAGAAGDAGERGRDSSFEGDNGTSGSDGGSAIAGAIYNEGNLSVIGCKLTNNIVAGGNGGDGGDGGNGAYKGGSGGKGGDGGNGQGGAIYNIGFVLVTNCTFSANSVVGGSGGNGGAGGSSPDPSTGHAGAGGAGAEASGAAVYNLGAIRLFNSTLSGNIATGGDSKKAGVHGNGWFGDNGANGGAGLGGGIYSTGTVMVVNCTFALNAVTGGNGGDGGSGSAEGGRGGHGGLASGGGIYSANMTAITNCTLSANAALGGTNGLAGSGPFPGSDGSMGQSRGGNIAAAAGIVVLANSILAKSTNGGNAFGAVTDAGHNISSDNSINLTGMGSLKNTDPNLSALGDFGGPTQTMLPMAGSAAIDRGSAGGCLAIDQRGASRPADGACDAGAVEASGLAIQSQPQDQTVAIGATVDFSVSPVGDPPFTYRWLFQITNGIPGATNMTLTLEDVQSTNAGGYNVIVSNSGGAVTSSVATLKVIVPASLQSPAFENGTNFTFRFLGVAGQTYVLEFKDALTDSNWIKLKTNAGDGGLLTHVVPFDGTTSRFFRVMIK